MLKIVLVLWMVDILMEDKYNVNIGMVKLITKEMHSLLFFKIKDFKSMGIKLNKDL